MFASLAEQSLELGCDVLLLVLVPPPAVRWLNYPGNLGE
jgi:hypothetical protein